MQRASRIRTGDELEEVVDVCLAHCQRQFEWLGSGRQVCWIAAAGWVDAGLRQALFGVVVCLACSCDLFRQW